MQLSNRSGVPVYTISGSNTSRQLPEWLARKRKQNLKRDPEYANRVELLQDFEFAEASQCVRVSEDGDWVVSTGTYKPQIHVHSLAQLSLSYSRHTNALNHSFQLLASDYSKSLHLQTDRSLEFHTPQGCHYTTRIPRYGRDLKYDRRSAEAIIASVGTDFDGKGEVFRLNLELGKFMRSYSVEVGADDVEATDRNALQGGVAAGSVNCAAVADGSHNLLAFGTSRGTVEFFDPRTKARVASLQPLTDPLDSSILSDTPHSQADITALQFHSSGLTLGTGSAAGLIHLFDLRSRRPLLAKDHGYGYPVQTLTFLSSSSSRTAHLSSEPKILSADKRIIKLWDAHSGAAWTSVEPNVDMNCVEWVPDTGMLLTANEGQPQHSFFIPQLGPAPRWCSFIDNMVEEMAEDADDPNAYENTALHKSGEIYDNYKFLTLPQLQALKLDHLVGTTNMLRPYMHGFFVQQRLYEEARIVSQPEVWAEEREKKIRERIDKERQSRIRGSKKVNVKVNKALADKLVARERKNQERKAKRAVEKASRERTENENGHAEMDDEQENLADHDIDERVADQVEKRDTLLTDPRFSALFQNPDYAVNEHSTEFRALNASTKIQEQNKEYQRDLTKASGLTAVELEELDSKRGSSSSEIDEASEDDDTSGSESDEQQKTSAIRDARTPRPRSRKAESDKSGSSVSFNRKPQMHVSSSVARPASMSASESFGTRLAQDDTAHVVGRRANKKAKNVVGEKEITFTVSNKKKQNQGSGIDADDAGRSRPDKKRENRRSASGNTFRRM